MAQKNVISIGLPEVVIEEWRTQQLAALESNLQAAKSALSKIDDQGHVGSSAAIAPTLATSIQNMLELELVADDLVTQSVRKLVADTCAQVLEVKTDHGKRVIDAYFAGTPPFSGAKARKDFPDSFVYEAILDMLASDVVDSLIVVTNDKNLSKFCSAIETVDCIASLADLVESHSVRSEIDSIESEETWQQAMPRVIANLQELGNQVLNFKFSESFVDLIAGIEVHHPSLPSDNRSATLSSASEPYDVEIYWDELEDYGPGTIRVTFSCRSEVLLDFYVYRADAYDLPDAIKVDYGDPESDHYFEAQAYAEAQVGGYFVLLVGNWTGPDDEEGVDALVDELGTISLIGDDAELFGD